MITKARLGGFEPPFFRPKRKVLPLNYNLLLMRSYKTKEAERSTRIELVF